MTRLKIIAGFALVGFVVACVLLGYSAYCFHARIIANTRWFPLVCPPSLLAIGLDSASVLEGLLGWLVIAVMNAVLYVVPGTIAAMILIRHREPLSDLRT